MIDICVHKYCNIDSIQEGSEALVGGGASKQIENEFKALMKSCTIIFC